MDSDKEERLSRGTWIDLAAMEDWINPESWRGRKKELVGEYLGTNAKTLFGCKKHNETHLAAQKQRLKGQGLHCCHVANGRAMGRLTGPLNGWSGDSVWQSLTGQSTKHEPTKLYLFDSPDTELLK